MGVKPLVFLPGSGSADDLSLKPLLKDIERYSFQKFKGDMWAAFLVALISIPQALAYSFVVGVPPAAGILSMVLGTAIAALIASSRHLVIGPNNASCLLVQAGIAGVFQKYYAGIDASSQEAISLQLLALLIALVGGFQLIAAVLKLGRLTQFVSHSVIVGYINGTALALCVGQVFPLFGMSYPDSLETLYEKMIYWFFHLKDAHILTVIIGLSSLLLFRVGRWMKLKILVPIFVIVGMTLVVAFLHLDSISDILGQKLVLVGSSVIKPTFELRFFELRFLNVLLPTAFAIAVIGMLEAGMIAKSIAAMTGQRLNCNNEVLALGSANASLSLFGGLPCSGSASRSILNLEGGAESRFAALFSSCFVAVIVYLLAGLIQYVPIVILAALLFATALRLVDIKQIRLCWRATHSDAFVLSTTFFSCIFFSLPVAFYIGVALSIMLYLRKAAVPHVVEYFYNEETDEFYPMKEEEKKVLREVRIINVEGELFFGAMDIFQNILRAIAEDDRTTKVIILRLKHAYDVDATTALGLKQLKNYLQKTGKRLIVCNIPMHVTRLLENSDLVNYLGSENLIPHEDAAPHASLKRAVALAYSWGQA